MNFIDFRNGSSLWKQGGGRFVLMLLVSVLVTSGLVSAVVRADDGPDFRIAGDLAPSAAPAPSMHSLSEMSSKDGSDTFDRSTDSLEAVRDRVDLLAPSSTALSSSTWTSARAGYLDYLDTDLKYLASTALGTPASGSVGGKVNDILADTADIQPKLGAVSAYSGTYSSGTSLFLALKDIRDTLAGTLTLSGGLTVGGTISGDGSGVTNIDASSVDAGTLGTDHYSAYNDLTAESKIGTSSGQLMPGDTDNWADVGGDTMSGTLYFAGGTDYYVNDSGNAKFNVLQTANNIMAAGALTIMGTLHSSIAGSLDVAGGYSGSPGGGVSITADGDIKLDGSIYQAGDLYTVDSIRYTGNLEVADILKVGVGSDGSNTDYLSVNQDGEIESNKSITLYFDKDNNSIETFTVQSPAGNILVLDESGNITLNGNMTASGLTASGNVSLDGGTFVFNESGADKDFRVEGDTDTELLFADASADMVGIGTSLPSAELDVRGYIYNINKSGDAAKTWLKTFTSSEYGSEISFTKSRSATIGTDTETLDDDRLGVFDWYGVNSGNHSDWAAAFRVVQDGDATAIGVPAKFQFFTSDGTGDPVQRMSIDKNGDVSISYGLDVAGNVSLDGGTFVFNESGADKDFRVEGDTDTELLFADASADMVGIGTSSPSEKLEVDGNMKIAAGSVFKIGDDTVLSIADNHTSNPTPATQSVRLGDGAGTGGKFMALVGYGAGEGANTSSQYVTALGWGAGNSVTSGSMNVFLGSNAGSSVTTGADNTMVGHNAGSSTTGSSNTFVGRAAGFNATTGSENIFVGNRSGANAGGTLTGSYNTLVGGYTGYDTTSGANNVFLGYNAGADNTTGTGNVYLGYQACSTATTDSDKLCIATGNTESDTLIYGDFNTGKTGLGTKSPQNRLDVEGGAVIGASYSGTETAPSNGLLVEGSVGIGTASPGENLEIEVSDTSDPAMTFDSDGNEFTMGIDSSDSDKFKISDNTALGTNDRLVIDSSGNLSLSGGLDVSGNVSFDGGTFTFNDSGANKDFRVEGDSEENLLFVDASAGEIGIGTNNPGANLDVRGYIHNVNKPGNVAKMWFKSYVNSAYGSEFSFNKSRSATVGTNEETLSGDKLGVIDWYGVNSSDSSDWVASLRVVQDGDATATSVPTKFQFLTSDGTNDPTKSFLVNKDGRIWAGSFTTSGSATLCWDNSGGSYINNCSSSLENKKNVEDLPFGIETVMGLKPRIYQWKDTDMVDLGFIAEETHESAPIITGYGEGNVPETVKYRHAVALLTKAIQEIVSEVCDKDGSYSFCNSLDEPEYYQGFDLTKAETYYFTDEE